MSTDHLDSSNYSAHSTAKQREKTGQEVICKICQAVYVPAQTHVQLAHSPHAVVESTFMSMCHFCFRCRQPACPSCWDEVHGVCGACALEAQLPFRASVPPLDGMAIPPIQHLQAVRVRTVTPPLVCVQPGRFQQAPMPIEAQTTLFYLPTISDESLPDATKKYPLPKMPAPASKPQNRALDHIPDIADIATQTGKRRVQHKETSRKAAIRSNKLMRTVTEILLLITLVIVICIMSALFFPSVNNSLAYLLHVDIHAKIAYLVELIQHLF